MFSSKLRRPRKRGSLTEYLYGELSEFDFEGLGHETFEASVDDLPRRWKEPRYRNKLLSTESVHELDNPSILCAFALRRLQYRIRGVSTKTKLVYHGTPAENAEYICEKNFNRSLVTRHVYGSGVSFATSTSYVARCTHHKSSEIAVFVCLILLGDVVPKTRGVNMNAISIDTGHSVDGNVYVKARSDEFLPLYIVFCEKLTENKPKPEPTKKPSSNVNSKTKTKNGKVKATVKKYYSPRRQTIHDPSVGTLNQGVVLKGACSNEHSAIYNIGQNHVNEHPSTNIRNTDAKLTPVEKNYSPQHQTIKKCLATTSNQVVGPNKAFSNANLSTKSTGQSEVRQPDTELRNSEAKYIPVCDTYSQYHQSTYKPLATTSNQSLFPKETYSSSNLSSRSIGKNNVNQFPDYNDFGPTFNQHRTYDTYRESEVRSREVIYTPVLQTHSQYRQNASNRGNAQRETRLNSGESFFTSKTFLMSSAILLGSLYYLKYKN